MYRGLGLAYFGGQAILYTTQQSEKSCLHDAFNYNSYVKGQSNTSYKLQKVHDFRKVS